MAFVGESRKDTSAAWSEYACIDPYEVDVLIPIIKRELKKAEAKVEYYQGLNEAGTISSRQYDLLDKYEAMADDLTSVLNAICRLKNIRNGFE